MMIEMRLRILFQLEYTTTFSRRKIRTRHESATNSMQDSRTAKRKGKTKRGRKIHQDNQLQ